MKYFVTNQKQIGQYDGILKANPEEVLSYFSNKTEIQLDTETTGILPFENTLLSLQLGDRDNQFVIDAGTQDIKIFKQLLEDKSKLIIIHYSLFDLLWLYKYDIFPFENVFDTFIAEKIISLGIDSHKCSLDACTRRYLKISLRKDLRGAIHRLGIYNQKVLDYAFEDVTHLQNIRDSQMRIIQENGLINAVNLENLYAPVLAYIKYCGIKIDTIKWMEKARQDEIELNEILNTLNHAVEELNEPRFLRQPDLFNSAFSCNINWDSAKQVIELFKYLGFSLTTIDKDTKKEKLSVEAKVLKPQKDKHPIAGIYLNYRKKAKSVSTYGKVFTKHPNKVTGRIHTNFQQLMHTGRLSSGGSEIGSPNLQNLPRLPDREERIAGKLYERLLFVPEKGYDYVVADFGQQEARILAELSGDSDYYDYVVNKDIHCFSARLFNPGLSNLSDKEIKQHHSTTRTKAKSISFAIPYGGNGMTIAMNLSLPISEGERIYNGFMTRFPNLHKYFEYAKERTLQQGYVLINSLTGLKCYFPQYDEYLGIQSRLESYTSSPRSGSTFKGLSSEFWEFYRSHKQLEDDLFFELKELLSRYFKIQGPMERAGLNFTIQGTGAAMNKLAAIYLYREIIKRDHLKKVKIVLQVHDENILEVPKEYSKEYGEILLQCMVEAGKTFCKNVEITADVHVGDTWEH